MPFRFGQPNENFQSIFDDISHFGRLEALLARYRSFLESAEQVALVGPRGWRVVSGLFNIANDQNYFQKPYDRRKAINHTSNLSYHDKNTASTIQSTNTALPILLRDGPELHFSHDHTLRRSPLSRSTCLAWPNKTLEFHGAQKGCLP